MKILISKNAKIVIPDEELEKVLDVIEENPDARLVPIMGQFIQPAFISEIFDLDFYIKQESDQLKLKNLRRCRHCGEILDRKDPCACKDKPELREHHPFKIQDKKLLT